MRQATLLLILSITTFLIRAQDKQALEVLKKANARLNQNVSIQYDYTYMGWGKNNGRFQGKVYINKNGGLQLGISLKTMDQNGKVIMDEYIYTNGNDIKSLDKTNKVLKTGMASNGSGYLMSYGWYAVFREFLMPDPMVMNYQNKTLAYDGAKLINGIACHMVSLINQWGDKNIWYIGKADHQVYGQKTLNENPETEGGFEFLMSNTKYNEPIDEKVFTINDNEVKVTDEDSRLIVPGNPAPEWTMGNSRGANVTSRDLKGKKVLLDFWASWCSPCWQIMPIINKIKMDYEDEAVVVYGVNVWENPKKDIKAYLKEKGLNAYEILFDKDATVAKSFKVGTLPFVVLIDENGQILYVNSGMDQKMDENIRALLDK